MCIVCAFRTALIPSGLRVDVVEGAVGGAGACVGVIGVGVIGAGVSVGIGAGAGTGVGAGMGAGVGTGSCAGAVGNPGK